MKKIVAGLGVAVVIAAVGVATLWLQLREERTSPATQQQASGQSVAAPVAAPTLAAATAPGVMATDSANVGAGSAVTAQAAVAPAVMPPTQPAATAAGQAAPSTEEAMNARVAETLQAMARPEAADSLKMMMRGMMAQMYPDLAAEVGLDAAQANALMDLLAEQAGNSGAEIGMLVGGAQQDARARREANRQMVEKQRSQEQAVRDLLGDKHPRWEAYQVTAAARTQVQQLRATLGASGNPLSDAQAGQLVTAFASVTQRTQRDLRDWMYSDAALDSPNLMQETIRRTVDTQLQMTDAAAPLLTAAQQEVFRRQMEMAANVLRATSGAAGAAGAGGGAAPAAP